jgi:hypothetical protein
MLRGFMTVTYALQIKRALKGQSKPRSHGVHVMYIKCPRRRYQIPWK